MGRRLPALAPPQAPVASVCDRRRFSAPIRVRRDGKLAEAVCASLRADFLLSFERLLFPDIVLHPMKTPAGSRVAAVILLLSLTAAAAASPVIDGITFSDKPEKLYVPVSEATDALHWKYEDRSDWVFVNEAFFRAASLRKLVDGTRLISLADLALAGATMNRKEGSLTTISDGLRGFKVRDGAKRAVIDIGEQRLRAWQGDRLVLESRVSTGRGGRITPRGLFHAGPFKARMHRSRLYDNAPMPWSVQVTGNIFIHGFSSVPTYPASHGCIRVPLGEGNPAKWFYRWVDIGTPIEITGHWHP